MTEQAPGARMSIVIPAHNEERVLGRTLDALLVGADAGEFEIVVACNGCTDGTEALSRSYGPAVTTVVSSIASKAAALNAGDQAAGAFPRVFLDADIEVGVEELRAVCTALTREDVMAAAPGAEFDTRGCSWPVKAYYAVWTRLPYVAEGLVGTGFYAVSRRGRARFEAFPDIVADDLFVQRLFAPGERVTVSGTFRVRPPRDIGSLLRSKVRVYAGNRQYAAALAAGHLTAASASTVRDAGTYGTSAAFRDLARDPRWWPRLLTYALIVATAKARADLRVRRGAISRWDQDTSGRR